MRVVFIKQKEVKVLIWALAILFLGVTTAYSINSLGEGYRVTASSQTVDVYNACYEAQTTSGSDVFIPTNSSVEWDAFLANKPSNVSLSSCEVCTEWTYVSFNTEWYVFKSVNKFRIYWNGGYPAGIPVISSGSTESYTVGGYRYERGTLQWSTAFYASYAIRRCEL